MTIDVQELTQREDTRTLVMHDRATETISRMFAQCEKIRTTFGVGKEYEKAVTSLHQALDLVQRKRFSPAAYVTAEGELSLYVQESGFVFGVVFFRDKQYDGTDRANIAGDWSCHS